MMPLRPRYSLLALLLFTALVAGGVKLWRGPHRVLIDSQTTPFGDDVSVIFPSSTRVPWGPFELECEYIREFRDVRYVAMLGWPDKKHDVYLQRVSSKDTGKAYLRRAQVRKLDSIQGEERVLCWFFENERHVEQKPTFWKDQWKAYLLTDRRKIYSCEPWTAQALVSEVDPSQIEDWSLRDCMQGERDKLP